MSDKTAIRFHEERSKLVGCLIDFLKAAVSDERDIEEELDEAKEEAMKYV